MFAAAPTHYMCIGQYLHVKPILPNETKPNPPLTTINTSKALINGTLIILRHTIYIGTENIPLERLN